MSVVSIGRVSLTPEPIQAGNVIGELPPELDHGQL
jgi:hypothetical protein